MTALPLVTTLGFAAIVVYLGAMTVAMQRSNYDVWGAFLLAPAMIVLPAVLFIRVARHDPDTRMRRLLVVALWAKLLGTVLRYGIIYVIYGSGDSVEYDKEGARLAFGYRRADFHIVLHAGSAGTHFVDQLTGWIYTATGPSAVLGFIVYSWLSFLGLYLFYRAFTLAFPSGDHYRYAKFLFFLPSLVYWPSSIGKDAWMIFGLGTAVYGTARLLTSQRGGFLLLGLGLWATAAVRPHITLAIMASVLIAYVLRRSRTSLSVVGKVVGVALIVVASVLVLSKAEQFFRLGSVNGEAATSVLDEAQSRTNQGGSAFAGHPVRSPIDLPLATVTVLFRPLPFEVHNAQTAIASLESTIFLGICILSAGRLRTIPRELFRSPFVAMAVTYTLIFIIAFSNINNFGILARQRVQLFPMFLGLLALPRRSLPDAPESPRFVLDDVREKPVVVPQN
jgi:hypothetical protein